jgi:outer membrane protein OmpA-like peptidoglycan-associated protein
VVNNRIYETDLPPLLTERPDGYSTGAFYANLGLGIRFRLGPRVELFVQSDFIYAFTDYLDDVSGTYRESYDNAFQAYAAQPGTNVVDPENPLRGDPNSPNDWIIYHGVGLKFNLGFSKRAFSAPRLSTSYPDYTYTATRTTPRPVAEEEEEEPEADRDFLAPTNITNIQMGGPDRRTDSLVYKSQLMNWDQQILSRETRILSGRLEQQRLRQRQEELDRQMEDLRRDTLVTQAERDSLRELREENRIDLRYSLDSIQRREGEMETEIDSLKRLKDEYKFEQTDTGWDAGDFYWSPEGMAFARPFPERAVAPDTVAQAPEDAPTPPAARQQEEFPGRLDERIRRLEEENLRLQAEQEALRALPRENIYLPPSPPQRTEEQTRPRRPIVNIFREREQRAETPVREVQPETRILDGRDVERLMIGREVANIAGASLFGYALPSPAPTAPPPTEEPEPTDLEPTDPAKEEVEAEPDTEPEAPELRLLKSKTEVYFDINETLPSEEEALKLLPLVEFLKENEEFVLSLRGYADNTGNVAYNLKLIESRIEAVSEILTVRHGLSPDQIQTEIGGQIVRGAGRSSNERDRKVEARILRRE